MIKRDNFFKNYIKNSSSYRNNLKKTKKIFNSFLNDLKNFDIPLIETYEKDYQLDFSKKMVKKFSKYQNIIIVGLGGSILGTKSIYSFFNPNSFKRCSMAF